MICVYMYGGWVGLTQWTPPSPPAPHPPRVVPVCKCQISVLDSGCQTAGSGPGLWRSCPEYWSSLALACWQLSKSASANGLLRVCVFVCLSVWEREVRTAAFHHDPILNVADSSWQHVQHMCWHQELLKKNKNFRLSWVRPVCVWFCCITPRKTAGLFQPTVETHENKIQLLTKSTITTQKDTRTWEVRAKREKSEVTRVTVTNYQGEEVRLIIAADGDFEFYLKSIHWCK